jgi:hypothetical protein
MTLPQIVSLISTILLTTIAIIIGIQLIQVLKELKQSLGKLNRTLDTADETLEKISQPASAFFAIIEGFRQSGKIIETISQLLGRDKPKTPSSMEHYDKSR